MDAMPISKVKASCLATLDRVRRTGRPVLVTRFGKPMAEIVPPTASPPQTDWLGKLASTGKNVWIWSHIAPSELGNYLCRCTADERLFKDEGYKVLRA